MIKEENTSDKIDGLLNLLLDRQEEEIKHHKNFKSLIENALYINDKTEIYTVKDFLKLVDENVEEQLLSIYEQTELAELQNIVKKNDELMQEVIS
tara:strand:- start:254 stop:538 length:285 start_codon:yes stop_codon:yes gene_type:complete